jgi:hypothetical protein
MHDRAAARQDEGVEEVAAALDLGAGQHAQQHHDHGRQRRVAHVVLQLPHRQRLARAQRVQLVDQHLRAAARRRPLGARAERLLYLAGTRLGSAAQQALTAAQGPPQGGRGLRPPALKLRRPGGGLAGAGRARTSSASSNTSSWKPVSTSLGRHWRRHVTTLARARPPRRVSRALCTSRAALTRPRLRSDGTRTGGGRSRLDTTAWQRCGGLLRAVLPSQERSAQKEARTYSSRSGRWWRPAAPCTQK